MILTYHRIVADIALAEREAIIGLVTSTSTFRRHLELVRAQCDVVTLAEAVRVLKGERSVSRPVAVITFDDGYRDNYENALPVLRELGLPATIFLPTGLVDSDEPLQHDRIHWLIHQMHEKGLDLHPMLEGLGLRQLRIEEIINQKEPGAQVQQIVFLPFATREILIERLEKITGTEYPEGFKLLTWQMVQEMQQAGISFGGHSDQHPILTLEGADTIERELRRNKRMLEDRLNCPAQHFAYPNGRYNETIKNIVARLGFAVAVTTRRGIAWPGDDLYALSRVGLCEESTRGASGRYSPSVAAMRLMV